MRFFVFILSLILCVAISLVVVIHSVEYLKPFLGFEIAWLIGVVVEVAFVSYSILGAVSGRWEFTDQTLKALLFFLSIIPATMSISQQSRDLFVDQATRQAPPEPKKPTELTRALDDKIQGIDDEIKALRSFKNSYDFNKQSRTWYAFQDQKRIDALIKERNISVQERIELEKEWSLRANEYQSNMATFEKTANTDQYTLFFNLATLIWTLSFIIVMQFLNGRLSRNCALIAVGGFKNQESPQMEDELAELILHTAPASQHSAIKSFLVAMKIRSLKDFKTFLGDGYEKSILKARQNVEPETLVWLASVHQAIPS